MRFSLHTIEKWSYLTQFGPDIRMIHDSATIVDAETGISVLIHWELYAMNEFYQKLLKNNKLTEQKSFLLKICFM